MKVLGLILPLALVALALQVGSSGQPTADDTFITSGIDGSSGPNAVCENTDGTPTSGCQLDDSKRMVVAAIDGTD